MTELLVFLLALPLSVYLLAGAMSLADGESVSRALLLRLALAVAFVALTPVTSRIWIVAAFATVLFLHVVTSLVIRYVLRSGRWPAQRIDPT